MVLGLDALEVGDDPAAWAAAGFTVHDGEVVIGRVRIRCLDDDGGADRWRLRTEPGGPDLPRSVDGLATSTTTDEAAPPVAHPNGVVALDHIVLRSPDLDRTTAALGSLGLDLRRTRDVGTAERPVQQRFFRLGDVILELVGPSTPMGDGPCSIWGYAVVSDDLEATAATLGEACSSPKEAVQPGRRIATIRTRALGIGVTLAVMTPHVRPPR